MGLLKTGPSRLHLFYGQDSVHLLQSATVAHISNGLLMYGRPAGCMCLFEANSVYAGGRKKSKKAGEDGVEHRPDAELVIMDIGNLLEGAPASPGNIPWPSPEQQAESQMEFQNVSANPMLPWAHLQGISQPDCS